MVKITQNGSKVFYIAGRHSADWACLVGLNFNGSYSTQINNYSWTPKKDNIDVNFQKFSIVLSSDTAESRIFTFTSNTIEESSVVANDCRMDVFTTTDLAY